MGGRRIRSGISGVGVAALVLLLALESSADWKLYVSGGIGISGAEVDTDGVVFDGVTTTPFSGDDTDSSPLIDGAFGLEIPMNEILPREWLGDIWLPDWPVRFEMEGAGLREYEFQTTAGSEKYFTEMTASTFFVNFWLDVPMVSAYRPIQYVFGLGRQPRVRQWLEPASFFFGTGVGFAAHEIKGTSNVFSSDEDFIDFAWNAGAGVNYALTDLVDLSFGYRFLGLADQDVELQSSGPTPIQNELTYENLIHELRVQVRVEVFDFLSPWR